MKVNQWHGRRFSQWIEMNLRKHFGDEWMLNNPPSNFEVLQKYSQSHKFACSEFEYVIGNKLRARGLLVAHQVIYFNRYIADLALPSANTIIEIDGLYHDHPFQRLKDDIRDKVFYKFGFDVHRIKVSMSPSELDMKISNLAKAYKWHAKDYRLKPLVRPVAIEKITPQGIIQKALNLKKRISYKSKS